MSDHFSIFEKGDIYFFYYPKVVSKGEESSITGMQDVERMFFIIRNHASHHFRKIVVGKKHMPTAAETAFAFVDQVVFSPDELNESLEPEEYSTSTRGERERDAARPIAEGKYLIVSYGRNTYLAYQLVKPKEVGDPQREINIEEEGNYVISVKNPEIATEKGLSPREKAHYSPSLQEHFHNRRFMPLNPPDYLEYEGAELLLIGENSTPDEKWSEEFYEALKSFPHEDIQNEFKVMDMPTYILRGQWEPEIPEE